MYMSSTDDEDDIDHVSETAEKYWDSESEEKLDSFKDYLLMPKQEKLPGWKQDILRTQTVQVWPPSLEKEVTVNLLKEVPKISGTNLRRFERSGTLKNDT
jgi:hypothetical protein